MSKRFRTKRSEVQALDDINLRVAQGEFVCLVGPSGCGKTTLLDIMAGLTKPDRGRVLADDQLVEGPGRHRLVMFQESALFPWLNVFGNVMFGLKRKPGLTERERREIAEHHLRLVGLGGFQASLRPRAVRRHEAARRAGALAGARSARAADGRAVCARSTR